MSRSRTSPARRPTKPVTFETVRQIALGFPEVEEGTSYGTPSFHVRKKLLARLHDDSDLLVLKVDLEARDVLMQTEPQTFFVTDHYVGYPLMLVRLSTVRPDDLRRLFEDAWRAAAPKRLVAAYDRRS